MALAYATTLRNARLDAVDDDVNGGGGAGFLRIYDGTRPASGGAATTLLAELALSATAFGAAASGVLTANGITADSSANAGAPTNATWFRLVDNAGVFVVDGDVAASGSDLNLSSIAITAGDSVSVSAFSITEGNP